MSCKIDHIDFKIDIPVFGIYFIIGIFRYNEHVGIFVKYHFFGNYTVFWYLSKLLVTNTGNMKSLENIFRKSRIKTFFFLLLV